MMRLLIYLSEVFIGTFGITRPAPEKERQVSVALGGFILVSLLGGFALVFFLLYNIRTSH